MPNNQIFLPFEVDADVIANDPLFDQVILLLNNDGEAGTSTWVDKSPKARTVSKVGAPTVDGNNGMSLRPGYYLRLPASPDWVFPGDFCMEFWLTGRMAATQVYLNGGPMTNNTHWSVLSSGEQMQFYPQGATAFSSYDTVHSVRHHIAAYRIGDNFYMAVDGKHLAPLTQSGPVGNATYPLIIGQRPNDTGQTNATLGPVRITNGSGRYSVDDFMPPPFGPFPTQ